MNQPAAAPPSPTHRVIEFNALDPITRQRFVDVTMGRDGPRPILAQYSSAGGAMAGWAMLSLLGMAVVLGLAAYELGNVYHFWQSPLYIAGYAVGFFLACWGALRLIRTAKLARDVPFKRGRYLFPLDMVIATDTKLTIVPMSRLTKLDGVHRHVNGIYQATDLNLHFEGFGRAYFSVRGKTLAEQVMADMRAAGQRVRDAVQQQDLRAIGTMDVFFEARGTEQWDDPALAAHLAAEALKADPQGTPTYRTADRPASPRDHKAGVFAKPSGLALSRAALFSLGAIALAPIVWFGRNLASDEMAYSAVQHQTTYAIRGYIHADGRHAQACIDEHLPEAAFREAGRAGTVTALRDFVRDYPQSDRVAEARATIHERFVGVRQSFMAQAATGDPNMPVFMGHLLEWLEAHDSPPVWVRFMAPSGEALSLIDQNLDTFGELQGVTGGIAPVSPHFTAARSAPRERGITHVLQRGFGPIFPEDVMQLQHGGRIDAATQAINTPTFDVTYAVRPSGSVYTSDTSARGFVGIHVDFHILMRFPGSAETFAFDTSVEPPEHFTVSNSYGRAVGGDYQDGVVYSVMADRAFDQLGNQLALTFFRPDTLGYTQARAASERDMAGSAPPPVPSSGLPGLEGLTPEQIRDLARSLGDGLDP